MAVKSSGGKKISIHIKLIFYFRPDPDIIFYLMVTGKMELLGEEHSHTHKPVPKQCHGLGITTTTFGQNTAETQVGQPEDTRG
jgi:hypothetical protein